MSFRLMLLAALTLGACAKKTETAPTPAGGETAREKGPVLDPVLFDSGVKTVASTQEPAVDAAAEVLKTSDWSVLVLGLADSSGDPELNKALSQERADAVAAMLRQKATGVEASRITTFGIGEKLATGETVQERKVEFVFYHENGLTPRQIVMQSGVLTDDFQRKREELRAKH